MIILKPETPTYLPTEQKLVWLAFRLGVPIEWQDFDGLWKDWPKNLGENILAHYLMSSDYPIRVKVNDSSQG